jgi:hypothetical protein
MKQCPLCKKIYEDDQLNFCLNDGEMLSVMGQAPAPSRYSDDSPPTVLLNQVRVTSPANWPSQQQGSATPGMWQGSNMQGQQQFGNAGFVTKKDQTLPTLAMILGISSIVLSCCYGGIWLGIPAAVLGFLGMRNADKDGNRYGGRGMAVAGMVLGIISLLASLIFALIVVANSN